MDTTLRDDARALVDTTAYLVLGTVDADGTPRVSPLYFGHDGYRDLYWVSHPDTHHSANLRRTERVAATVYDSASVVGRGRAVYLTGRAREVDVDELTERVRVAFRPALGGRAFDVEELTGDADLRLYVFTVDDAEVHVPAGHPTLGSGRDRRELVDLATD
jgi:nitroimidazol reductase NimA-like FMN-containing flavoprotein (pyridoxamine 5'-phosphate oxidase superfamily)